MQTLRNISALAAALALLGGCAVKNPGASPPLDGFYFPVSVALGPSASGVEGRVLFVASSNFDLRYNRGTVLAVDLDQVVAANGGLDGPVNQAVDPEKGFALIDNFAGQMLAYRPRSAPVEQRTLFVTSRTANALYPLHSVGATLACRESSTSGSQDCLDQGIALQETTALRADNPFGLAVHVDATTDARTLYITHVRQADDPPGSGKSAFSYLAHLDAESLSDLGFIGIGLSPAESIVDSGTAGGLYFTGRSIGDGSLALRSLSDGANAKDAGLTGNTSIHDARGLAVSSDKTKLFVTATSGNLTTPVYPEGLVIVDISPDPSDATQVLNRVLGFVALPAGASSVQVIARPGMRDLVAISCTKANAVALYDDELGALVAVVGGVQEPYGLVVAPRSPGEPALLYVASFGNDTVDVIQIQDPAQRPREATLIGHLGFSAHRPLGVALPSP